MTNVADLSERLILYAEQLMSPGPRAEIDLDADPSDWYVGRARRLGDTVSREQIIALQVAWDNTRARCCGFRADLPLGLCAACIRDGAVALDGADIAALTEHLWAVGNPVRAALARYVADVLRDPAADPRFRAFAKRLLMRRT